MDLAILFHSRNVVKLLRKKINGKMMKRKFLVSFFNIKIMLHNTTIFFDIIKTILKFKMFSVSEDTIFSI